MNILSVAAHPLRLGCALAIIAAASLSQAQTMRSAPPATRQTAPAVSPGSPSPSAPNPAGLPSPLPSPGGLTSRFPAGLPSPIGAPTTESAPIDAGVAPQTRVLSAGGVPAMPPSTGVGRGPFTALQIAQSFLGADANRDGELTRAEAQRLSIMPYSFEEMDRNRDGILSRFEYEDGVR